jgi:L-Ala-D/L-Glu epimerase
MKITKLECWIHAMPLLEPYSIAYETIGQALNVFLRAETDAGLIGWGCAAPDMEVTSETPEMTAKAFHDVIEPFLRGADPFRYTYILAELRRLLPQQPSAIAMVDLMLYDLMAQKAGEPLYKLLGGYRDCIATSITIGIMPLAETVERAVGFAKKGFKVIKLKGGAEVEADIEKIARIREAAGPALEIRFDANQGYTVAQALDFIRRTEPFRVELLEQPTCKHNEELLREVTAANTSVPVMADESLMTLKDVFHLTSRSSVDMINIKLAKVGGILEGLHINSVAKSDNVEVMVGCMDESALGISAGLHFALSRPNIGFADLDGHLDLLDDPFAGLVRLEDGVLYPNDKPGLGVGLGPG